MATSVQAQQRTSRNESTGKKSPAGQVVLRILFYILVAIILFYTLAPFYWALRSSFTGPSELFATPISYFPHKPTFDNYAKVFESGDFRRALLNSTIVAGVVTLFALVFGSLAAYALGRFKFRGRTPVLYLILAMTMFPQIAILGALYALFKQFGLYNTLTALILADLVFTLPFTVWVLSSFFKQMPGALEEAAYVDGATPFQTFWKVLLPLSAPGMVTTGLLAFIGAWNEFLFAVSFTATPDKRTVNPAILYFAGSTGSSFDIPWGQRMAATVVVTIPIVVLVLIFQRRILAGLTAGAVKG
ncbi:MAG: carbohydrate ABC transporter permease [Thermomicrobiales bacterium]|jgi:trehalose/maltose transport system permease protein|nr:carbohydrate ABC transporter permease [Thermomicrobiales bacterium]